MTTTSQALVAGALTMGYLVIALFFLRFWRQSADRFFLFFSASFAILAVQRIALVLTSDVRAYGAWLYSLRLLAFVLILAAIVDKNRGQ